MQQGGSQNLMKAGPDLRPVPFRRGINLAEGNRGPGLYSRKYGNHHFTVPFAPGDLHTHIRNTIHEQCTRETHK